MSITVNANTKDGRVELLGVSLSVAEAVELKTSIEIACALVGNAPAPTAPGEKHE